MADWNPIAAWRRLLALPNDNRAKTLAMAFAVSAVCAALVSTAVVVLRPIQAANRAAEEQARMAALIAGIPGMSDLLSDAGGELSTVVIDLDRGAAAAIPPEELATALDDAGNWTTLAPEGDIAGLGQRPNYVQVYFIRDAEGDLSLAILPIVGAGFNGRIEAILALQNDMNTIAGMAITSHSETPGLGARIEEPAWLDQFGGTEVEDASGNMRFAVARGAAGNAHEVDGITGATRTANAVTQMVRFWMGPKGYGPLIAAVRRREF
jgi:Na+-transporting NADH:ubiquinone oxidoreductase subunit C